HPSQGDVYFEGQKVNFKSPKDARDKGIEIVYQDLALVKIMSIVRNFFLGREVLSKKSHSFFLDINKMKIVTKESLENVGIKIRSSDEAASLLSGGERQAIAMARAYHFGAKLLILDEPTAALSIKESNRVLDLVLEAKGRGLSVVFISHNIYHVYPVADKLTILSHGKKLVDLEKKSVTPEYIIRAITHGKLD
ncbi:MAG: ATP-binding cassette domain-containing protein, partial [Atribacterota bacterium]|nr:ATP-binding cassette domain-containing protein [Atribacterota bacterium]